MTMICFRAYKASPHGLIFVPASSTTHKSRALDPDPAASADAIWPVGSPADGMHA